MIHQCGAGWVQSRPPKLCKEKNKRKKKQETTIVFGETPRFLHEMRRFAHEARRLAGNHAWPRTALLCALTKSRNMAHSEPCEDLMEGAAMGTVS